jgi:inosine-uridine nucleoside N-ribohydrolase
MIYPKSEQRIQSNQEVAKAIIDKLKDDSSGTRSRPQGTIIYGTDPGADIDDEALLCIASLLHKCNVSNVLLVVTNRENKTQRARSAKRIMKDMGASQIQIASGIDTGTDTRLYHTYGGNSSESDEVIPLGEPAVVDCLERLRKEKKRCKIVVVSSFSDLLKLLEKHADLVRETVSAFFFQGGWKKGSWRVKTLKPDMTITNNGWDPEATLRVHKWLRHERIPTFTTTRNSANQAAVSSVAFNKAVSQEHPVAKYIYNAWSSQEKKFFDQAYEEDPKKRFREHMDRQWYVNRHPRWLKEKGSLLPESFEEMRPYIDMTLYDVVAGLPCLLNDHSCFNKLFQPHTRTRRVGWRLSRHYIIGRSAKHTDVDADLLSELISQLLQQAFQKQ